MFFVHSRLFFSCISGWWVLWWQPSGSIRTKRFAARSPVGLRASLRCVFGLCSGTRSFCSWLVSRVLIARVLLLLLHCCFFLLHLSKVPLILRGWLRTQENQPVMPLLDNSSKWQAALRLVSQVVAPGIVGIVEARRLHPGQAMLPAAAPPAPVDTPQQPEVRCLDM